MMLEKINSPCNKNSIFIQRTGKGGTTNKKCRYEAQSYSSAGPLAKL